MFKGISHIGIAVYSLDKALQFYRDTLGLVLKSIEEIPHEGVRVAIFSLGEARIELLEPLDEKSPLHNILKKRGEGVHHIAIKSDSLKEDLAKLSQHGLSSLGEPRKGAEDSLITFIHPKFTHGVLLELCEEL